MAHTLILGMTEAGKSTLAKILVKGLKETGKVKIAVLDPVLDPDWGADFITKNPEEFLEYAKKNQNHFLVIDEGGTSIGKYNAEMDWLTTTSRHWGHSSIIISHRWAQLSNTLRANVSKLFLFALSIKDTDLIADEWRQPVLREAMFLKGEFYVVSRFGPLQKGRIDFDARKIYYDILSHQTIADNPAIVNSISEVPNANTGGESLPKNGRKSKSKNRKENVQ